MKINPNLAVLENKKSYRQLLKALLFFDRYKNPINERKLMIIKDKTNREFVVHGYQERNHTQEDKDKIETFLLQGSLISLEGTQYYESALDMYKKEQIVRS